MTVQELIDRLETMPKDAEMSVFDWKKNLYVKRNKGVDNGVVDKVVHVIEGKTKGGGDVVCLLFNNEDYDVSEELWGFLGKKFNDGK